MKGYIVGWLNGYKIEYVNEWTEMRGKIRDGRTRRTEKQENIVVFTERQEWIVKLLVYSRLYIHV